MKVNSTNPASKPPSRDHSRTHKHKAGCYQEAEDWKQLIPDPLGKEVQDHAADNHKT